MENALIPFLDEIEENAKLKKVYSPWTTSLSVSTSPTSSNIPPTASNVIKDSPDKGDVLNYSQEDGIKHANSLLQQQKNEMACAGLAIDNLSQNFQVKIKGIINKLSNRIEKSSSNWLKDDMQRKNNYFNNIKTEMTKLQGILSEQSFLASSRQAIIDELTTILKRERDASKIYNQAVKEAFEETLRTKERLADWNFRKRILNKCFGKLKLNAIRSKIQRQKELHFVETKERILNLFKQQRSEEEPQDFTIKSAIKTELDSIQEEFISLKNIISDNENKEEDGDDSSSESSESNSKNDPEQSDHEIKKDAQNEVNLEENEDSASSKVDRACSPIQMKPPVPAPAPAPPPAPTPVILPPVKKEPIPPPPAFSSSICKTFNKDNNTYGLNKSINTYRSNKDNNTYRKPNFAQSTHLTRTNFAPLPSHSTRTTPRERANPFRITPPNFKPNIPFPKTSSTRPTLNMDYFGKNHLRRTSRENKPTMQSTF